LTDPALVVATRSAHKLQEIQQLTTTLPELQLLSLADLSLPEAPEEDQIEIFQTFEENALAKARYFFERTGRPVLADDSGLCVDALEGAPGVRSKRFAGRADLEGIRLDRANNDKLMDSLEGVSPARRTAHYVCVVAFVAPGGHQQLFRGTVDGRILKAPAGSGGFGYDPLFYLPELDATFAQVTQDVKNRLSHRAAAVRLAIPHLNAWLQTAV
jgi:XTP/dITP diphosphohydrolase